jgi:hypothetical protein
MAKRKKASDSSATDAITAFSALPLSVPQQRIRWTASIDLADSPGKPAFSDTYGL